MMERIGFALKQKLITKAIEEKKKAEKKSHNSKSALSDLANERKEVLSTETSAILNSHVDDKKRQEIIASNREIKNRVNEL